MTKRALITGITGQDGSYLAEFLLSKGYEVHGLVRRSSACNGQGVGSVSESKSCPAGATRGAVLHYGDLCDSSSVNRLLQSIRPDEIYNLAAQSNVKASFEVPLYTGDVGGLGALRVLEGVRECGLDSRIYQAGSSEMFGKTPESPQRETTPFCPRSPYAAAKVYAHWLTVNYREAYGMFACNGIVFNHESPRRGEGFVTRKITLGVAAIKLGLQETLTLGNLGARRDWGFAGDYVEAMWLMLQQDKPDDYVIATGESRSVCEFCEAAFSYAGLDYRKHVVVDPLCLRRNDVDCTVGDASKARDKLGWRPRTSFRDLVRMMVDADLELLENVRKK